MRSEKNYSPPGTEAARVLRVAADVCTVIMCVSSVVIAVTLLVIGVKINGEYTRITRMVITEEAVADAHSLLHETSALSARAAAGDPGEHDDLALVARNLAAALTEALLALAAAMRGLRGDTLNGFLESVSSPEFKVATYGIVTRALDDLERVQNALGYIMSTVATSPK